MLQHIELYVSDLARSDAFWTPLLAHLAYAQTRSWSDGFTLEGPAAPYLTFVQVTAKHAHRPYHRCAPGLNHLAFQVSARDKVDALRAHCLEAGWPMLYDDRYPFATGPDYYALFVEDPDRMKLEFVAA